jgi:hypothetical protein
MTIRAKLLCAVAAFGFAAVMAALPAQALTMQECSAKYKAAKSAGTLNGEKWNDFRKSECAADAAATPAATPAAAPAAPPPAAAARPAKPAPTVAAAPPAAPAAPVITGNAVFPSAVDPKFTGQTPHLQRMRTCAAQWDVNKANNTTGGMKWNQKGGGGFYSVCNKRLKGET